MQKAWEKIRFLIESNAQHRKGFRLQEVELPFILNQAQLELIELMEEPDDMMELVDIFGVLIHYAVKQGWDIDIIEKNLIEKLDIRFNI